LTRDVLREPRSGGREFKYPRWRTVVFHIDARDGTADETPVDEPLRSGFPGGGKARVLKTGTARPLTKEMINSILQQYNQSGNPGSFTAIYDSDYVHLVPSPSADQAGQFAPVLSTIVPAALQQGSCSDLLRALISELQAVRGVTIHIGEWPTFPQDDQQCSIQGHNLVAREELTQLLHQIGHHSKYIADTKYTWVLVHDPTDDAYWLSTRAVAAPQVLESPQKRADPGDTTTPRPVGAGQNPFAAGPTAAGKVVK
jgi:hypothetical protein